MELYNSVSELSISLAVPSSLSKELIKYKDYFKEKNVIAFVQFSYYIYNRKFYVK